MTKTMKKWLTAAAVFLLFVLLACTALAADLPGDVNRDGFVTSADARLALRIAVGLDKYDADSAQMRAADVDKNGVVTAADARLILRAAVGLEDLSQYDRQTHEKGVFLEQNRLNLTVGGTAFFPVEAYYSDSFKVTYSYTSAHIRCGWSQWIADDLVFLYISVDDEVSNVPIEIYIEGDRSCSAVLYVSASYGDGYPAYYGDPTVPDAGVVWGVASTNWNMSDDLNYSCVVYDPAELSRRYDFGPDVAYDYEQALFAYGYEFNYEEYDEESNCYTRYYYHPDTGTQVAYNEYDNADGYVAVVTVEWLYPEN